jgi:disulfide bond formation protein DsbB
MRNLPATTICLLAAALSGAALALALIGQYGFDLHPCKLCVIQRIPFAVIIGLGITGFLVARLAPAMIALSGIAFLSNAGIALYHSGIERKWWTGLAGCSAPDMTGSVEDLMARIQSTAVTRCDEIPWSLFGLSMANYNVALCALAGILCFAYLFRRRRAP